MYVSTNKLSSFTKLRVCYCNYRAEEYILLHVYITRVWMYMYILWVTASDGADIDYSVTNWCTVIHTALHWMNGSIVKTTVYWMQVLKLGKINFKQRSAEIDCQIIFTINNFGFCEIFCLTIFPNLLLMGLRMLQ